MRSEFLFLLLFFHFSSCFVSISVQIFGLWQTFSVFSVHGFYLPLCSSFHPFLLYLAANLGRDFWVSPSRVYPSRASTFLIIFVFQFLSPPHFPCHLSSSYFCCLQKLPSPLFFLKFFKFLIKISIYSHKDFVIVIRGQTTAIIVMIGYTFQS